MRPQIINDNDELPIIGIDTPSQAQFVCVCDPVQDVEQKLASLFIRLSLALLQHLI